MTDPLIEILPAVAEMRHHQREYFRSRSTAALAAARAAEKRVDDLLDAMVRRGQRTLFDKHEEE